MDKLSRLGEVPILMATLFLSCPTASSADDGENSHPRLLRLADIAAMKQREMDQTLLEFGVFLKTMLVCILLASTYSITARAWKKFRNKRTG